MATTEKKPKQDPKPQDNFDKRIDHEEWRCEIKVINGARKEDPKTYTATKMKKIRDNVNITTDQAKTLNRGYLYGGNTYADLYFLPGAGETLTSEELEN